jgi:hypothetical protein
MNYTDEANLSISTNNKSLVERKFKNINSFEKGFYQKLKYEEADEEFINETENFVEELIDEFGDVHLDIIRDKKELKKDREYRAFKQKKAEYRVEKIKNNRQRMINLIDSPKAIRVDLEEYWDLVEQFRNIGIELKLTDMPFDLFYTNEINTQSFICGIYEKKGKHCKDEYLSIYPGVNSKVEILDINYKHKEILVKVQEPERIIFAKNYSKNTIEEKKKNALEKYYLFNVTRYGKLDYHHFTTPFKTIAEIYNGNLQYYATDYRSEYKIQRKEKTFNFRPKI